MITVEPGSANKLSLQFALDNGKLSKVRKPEHEWEAAPRPEDNDWESFSGFRPGTGRFLGPRPSHWYRCRDCGAVGWAQAEAAPVRPWIVGACGVRFNNWPPKVAPIGFDMDEQGVPKKRPLARGRGPTQAELDEVGGIYDDTYTERRRT